MNTPKKPFTLQEYRDAAAKFDLIDDLLSELAIALESSYSMQYATRLSKAALRIKSVRRTVTTLYEEAQEEI